MITEPDKLFYQAERLLQEGDIQPAGDILMQTVSRFPEYGRAHSLLATIYHRHLHDIPNAEVFYKKAIALSPEFTPSYIGLAEIFLLHERYPELIANLNKAIEIPGIQKDKVYEQFGRMNELQVKLEEAISNYKKAIFYSFRDEDIISYENAIRRCVKKKNY